jgi:DNA-binding NarL/FixJ family response regulator
MIRVLVADDQALVREGIARLLEMSGEVTVMAEVGDGQAALRQLQTRSIDVALLDVRMPALNGIEVLRELRRLGHATPVIFLTTFDDDEVLLAAARLGASGYLLKDVGAAELVAAIRAVNDGRSLILPAVSERARRFVKAQGTPFEAAEVGHLTAREVSVLRLMARGCSNREIANALHAAEGTIKNHASSILAKLGVRDRTRAVLKALELGWLD